LEGDGFEVRCPFPTRALDHLDPFLLLHHLGPVDLAPGEAKGASDHPHRGFETVTYMLQGELEHRDSAGHHGLIEPGGVQWMTAGAGVVHSEMPSARVLGEGGPFEGVQLWVNLPRALKWTPPAYQDVTRDRIPVVDLEGGRARVISGSAFGVSGPATTHSPILYVHLSLAPGATACVPAPSHLNAFTYALSGVDEGVASVLAPDGDHLAIEGGSAGAEVLALAAVPLGDPVARYGPFVMSTRDEIVQAVEDYQAGRMGRIATSR
jgi:redox-sensitive bicupin YhaK (pirin superfamily)